jgi:hypothetical protein
VRSDNERLRDILIRVEDLPAGAYLRDMSVFGRDPVEVTEHVWLLERSGLV